MVADSGNSTTYNFLIAISSSILASYVFHCWNARSAAPKDGAPLNRISKTHPGGHGVRTPDVTFENGYNQTPTVQTILEITNALLDGKLIPTPVPTVIAAATPSPSYMP
jgi:hypothetical protein